MSETVTVNHLLDEVGYWKTRCRLLEERDKVREQRETKYKEYLLNVGATGSGHHDDDTIYFECDSYKHYVPDGMKSFWDTMVKFRHDILMQLPRHQTTRHKTMNASTYRRKENAIYRLQNQLERHTDKFWSRFVKIAKEVYGDLYKDIRLAHSSSDDFNGLYESVTYQGISHETGHPPASFAVLNGIENFRSNQYGYYYQVPEEMFWSDDDSLIRTYLEQKLKEHKEAIVKRAELELNRKRQEFEKLKQELQVTT